MAQKKVKAKCPNPFVENPEHYGPMTVRQLVEIVSNKDEFPDGLDTRLRIGDVEGNLGVISDVTVCAHKPCDIVLAVDAHTGDMHYEI